MNKLSELREFYDLEANNFHETRKVIWPEFWIIKDKINLIEKDKINILELWCWSWRFFRYLKDELRKDIEYTWLDFSKNLIWIANIENINNEWTFVVWDMINYLGNFDQQSFDVVIAIASFQHIDSKSKRINIFKHIYRVLTYWGILIMVNWSFSDRFIKKYSKQFSISVLYSILTFWFLKYNDLFIPWNTENKIFERYYHIFTLKELIQLYKMWWFVIKESWYVDRNWTLINSYKNSRNSIVVWVKDVL